jgi:hypothetical protein
MARPIMLQTKVKTQFNLWLAFDVTIRSFEFKGIATYPIKYNYVYTEDIPYKD